MIKTLLLIPLTIIPLGLTLFSIKQYSKKNYKYSKSLYIYDTIFIKFTNRTCAAHLNSRIKCDSNCSWKHLEKIVNLIRNAQKTISLCMYHITIADICDALIEAKKRGVHIRIIVDLVMKDCRGSIASKLSSSGIPFCTQKSKNYMMHHKFMLIDEREVDQKMLFGSCNFTLQALVSNWEHSLITNDNDIIICFSEEFDHLWKEFN